MIIDRPPSKDKKHCKPAKQMPNSSFFLDWMNLFFRFSNCLKYTFFFANYKHWSPFRRLASLGHHMQKWSPSRGLHLGLSWALFSPMWADDRTWAESLTLAGFQRIWHGRGMHPTMFGDVAASQII